MIDNDDLDWTFSRLQFQRKLALHSFENGRSFTRQGFVNVEIQIEIEESGESRLIDNLFADVALKGAASRLMEMWCALI